MIHHKGLSDRLYERTGLPLLGWISAIIAVVGFSFAMAVQLWKQ